MVIEFIALFVLTIMAFLIWDKVWQMRMIRRMQKQADRENKHGTG